MENEWRGSRIIAVWNSSGDAGLQEKPFPLSLCEGWSNVLFAEGDKTGSIEVPLLVRIHTALIMAAT